MRVLGRPAAGWGHQQRFLRTLLKEAEKLGYKVRGEAPYTLSLEVGRDEVEFTLHERIKQVRRPIPF